MLKHGDVSESTGLVFWSMNRGNERWLDPAKFLFFKNKSKISAKRSYRKNIEVNRKRMRDWHHENKEKKNSYFKKWYSSNSERIRNNKLIRTYGITSDKYNQMLESQFGCCAICGVKPQKNLCVDHCHTTGKVRSLLCVNCNTGIGQFMENPEILTKAAEYVKNHNRINQ